MPGPTSLERAVVLLRAGGRCEVCGLTVAILDDDRLDDPTYKPDSLTSDEHTEDHLDEAAIYRRTHGDKKVRLTKAEAAELVRRWANSGRSLQECERITGLKPDRYHRIGGAA